MLCCLSNCLSIYLDHFISIYLSIYEWLGIVSCWTTTIMFFKMSSVDFSYTWKHLSWEFLDFWWRRRGAFWIYSGWPAGIFVYTEVCDSQISSQNRVIRVYIKSKWHIYLRTFYPFVFLNNIWTAITSVPYYCQFHGIASKFQGTVNYEMLIKIFHSFLNRSINIIMDSC